MIPFSCSVLAFSEWPVTLYRSRFDGTRGYNLDESSSYSRRCGQLQLHVYRLSLVGRCGRRHRAKANRFILRPPQPAKIVSMAIRQQAFWVIKHGHQGNGYALRGEEHRETEVIWGMVCLPSQLPTRWPKQYQNVASSGGHQAGGGERNCIKPKKDARRNSLAS